MARVKLNYTAILSASMIFGAIFGLILQKFAKYYSGRGEIISTLDAGSEIFLHLIKMVIAPLVVSTLSLGIYHLGDPKAIGRIGGKALLWFAGASLASLLLGLTLATTTMPGRNLHLTSTNSNSTAPVEMSVKLFIDEVFPTSIIEAMAQNHVLQIVVFSIFLGISLSSYKDKMSTTVKILEEISSIMFIITKYVMIFSPLCVFCSLASSIYANGVSIIYVYIKLVGNFYGGLAILLVTMVAAGYIVIRNNVFRVILGIRQPAMIAFSTASSEAAFPKLTTCLKDMGIPMKISSFVLPLGYSFNLDGSLMYSTFSIIFLSQVYGIDLSVSDLWLLGLLLFVMSKGIAGVPRASVVVVAAILPYFNIPHTGVFLLLAVDQIMDMGRTAMNVVGNAIACAVVAHWEARRGDADSNPPAFA